MLLKKLFFHDCVSIFLLNLQLDAGHIVSSFSFFDAWYFVRCFPFLWHMEISQQAFLFFDAWHSLNSFLSCYVWNVLLKRFEMLLVLLMLFFLNIFHVRIKVYIYSKSSDSFVDTWGIHYWLSCTWNQFHNILRLFNVLPNFPFTSV